MSFGEEFYLTTRNPWRRLRRNLRLLGYIGFMAWVWLIVGGRVRRARRKALRGGQPYYVDELGSGQRFEMHVEDCPDGHGHAVRLGKWTHGIIASEQVFNHEFFNSPEYEHMAALGESLDGLLGDGAYVQRGERQQPVASFRQALEWMMNEARRGQHIQRYKGLGEMNPEQLWETTLDPETRRLLQVQIEDAVGSDDIFTTLMGDQVEPRRDFIEQNALSVSNLDV